MGVSITHLVTSLSVTEIAIFSPTTALATGQSVLAPGDIGGVSYYVVESAVERKRFSMIPFF